MPLQPNNGIMKFLKLSFILLVTLILSCKKEPVAPIDSSQKELTSFSLEASINPTLEETVEGTISNLEIRLAIPKSAQDKELIASFEFTGEAVYVDSTLQQTGITPNNFSLELAYRVIAEDGSEQNYSVRVEWVDDEEEPGTEDPIVLPHFYFQLDGHQSDINRENYIDAILTIDGKGAFSDFEGATGIRGRGNTSWGFPKKPYKIKLNSKASLLGLTPYKEWILLSEYLDGTMLYNSIPFKAAHLLGIPYTNNVIPVEITINGVYQGIYAFMEHKEVGPGRIDIGIDGLLLELDQYYDEDWKFRSPLYNLPVMIQYPKSKDMNQEVFNMIQNDFNEFESLVYSDDFPNNGYLNYFDDVSYINYMIVYQLTLNQEINHPKSTYINKLSGEKYRMGIIWDFDWAFGFEQMGVHYSMSTVNTPLFWSPPFEGTNFFSRFMEDPHMQNLFKERWQWFRANAYESLRESVERYSEKISPSVPLDHAIWGPRGSTGNPTQDLQKVLNWLDARAEYLDSYIDNL